MKYDMVIARYKEDITWLESFKSLEINKIIYNKYFKEDIFLENIGRESHTYLYHIIKNYDNLADITIFTQANPFDHSPDFINKIINCVKNKEKIQFKPLTIYNGLDILYCDMDGAPHHRGLNLKRGFDILFNKKYNSAMVPFHPGAIFIVSKENIKKRSKQFYENCLELCIDEDWKDFNGTLAAPYFFERVWRVIFYTDIS